MQVMRGWARVTSFLRAKVQRRDVSASKPLRRSKYWPRLRSSHSEPAINRYERAGDVARII